MQFNNFRATRVWCFSRGFFGEWDETTAANARASRIEQSKLFSYFCECMEIIVRFFSEVKRFLADGSPVLFLPVFIFLLWLFLCIFLPVCTMVEIPQGNACLSLSLSTSLKNRIKNVDRASFSLQQNFYAICLMVVSKMEWIHGITITLY